MESITPSHTCPKNLRCQARHLTSVVLSLINLFAQEARRLSRKDEASRLEGLCSSIRQQLYCVKSSEDAASYGNSQASLLISLGGLAVSGAIKMVSKDKQLSAVSDHLLKKLAGKQSPFGMVLVCIGPKGLPDGVEVVSISRLARESDRDESEVINKLQQRGCRLFSEKAFSLLIDRLIDGVLEGRLLLPISAEKLSEIKTMGYLKPECKNSE